MWIEGAAESVVQWARDLRTNASHARRLHRFRRNHKKLFVPDVTWAAAAGGPVLFVSPRVPNLEVNLALIHFLRASGRRIAVLDPQPGRFGPYFRLAGADAVEQLIDGESKSPDAPGSGAKALLSDCSSLEDLLTVENDGVRVGMFAASSLIRKFMIGDLDLADPNVREIVERQLGKSLVAADWAGRLIERLQPQAAIFAATEYTPRGELFDTCLGRAIETFIVEDTHRDSSLFVKRYSHLNRGQHVASLSEETWAAARDMIWTDSMRDRLRGELESGYETGEWYGVAQTQFGTRSVPPDEVRRVLGLDAARKTVFIFAHILFDAPFSWSEPLYTTYERWLVETIRAACGNDSVNWIVKIHPANRVKLGGRGREPAETKVIAREFERLPSHVKLMRDDTPISTNSLFAVMDVCVTVRGTIGIEAAARGIPVLTAANGRYSGRGFTIDSASREEYVGRLMRVEELEPLTDAQRDLAERYAYGLFVRRPFDFESVRWEHRSQQHEPQEAVRITLKTASDWKQAADLGRFTAWMADSNKEDYLSEAL